MKTKMPLPRSALQKLTLLGQGIRMARKRRNWTVSEFAKKLQVSSPTLIALEKGQPTVSVGLLFSALWILGLEKELTALTHFKDDVGSRLVDSRLPKKIRHQKQGLDNDF